MKTEKPPQKYILFILAMMIPLALFVLEKSMFSVALPAVRTFFSLGADTTAWLITAYLLPFMLFMPLYGRFGDVFGKPRLLLIGLAIFAAGSIICLLAPNLPLFIAGRIIQGMGGASINPLCLSIISESLPSNQRGKALGTWTSSGPVAYMLGSFLAGLLIDNLGWKTLFLPILTVALFTLVLVRNTVPVVKIQGPVARVFRTFDWVGFALLSGAVIFLVFYVSSRPITGVPPLRDWRILAPALPLFFLFIVRERHCSNPFLSFKLFASPNFTRASISTSLRMFSINGLGFLIPLYLSDIYHLPASSIGVLIMIQSGAFLVTMRLGGWLADIWANRWPVVISFAVQLVAIICYNLQSRPWPLGWFIGVLVLYGLGAGMSLAPLHRSVMSGIPKSDSGITAGLYSMIRSGGDLFGAALGGVFLQLGFDRGLLTLQAYQLVFWIIAAICLLSIGVSWGLKD